MLNPIFTVEALTTSRRRRYFIVRVMYGLLLLYILGTAYATSAVYSQIGMSGIANIARDFFFNLKWVQVTAVLVLTPTLTAGVIAGEFERKTLDYLLACPLSSFSILVGKLAARLSLVALLVATGVPVVATAMLLGGIPPQDLLITSVITLTTLLSTGCLTLAASVWSVRTRDAMLRAFVLLLALLIIPPVAYASTTVGSWNSFDSVRAIIFDIAKLLTSANPYVVVYAATLPQFIWVTISHLAFSAGVIAFAAWRLRSVAAHRAGAESKRWRRTFRWPRPALGTRPILWKEMFVEKTALRWGCLARGLIFVLTACILVPTFWGFLESLKYNNRSAEWIFFIYGWIASILLILTSARAATLVTGERERDTWLTLISTPLTAREIVWAKMLGNLYAMRWTVLVLVLLWIMGCVLKPANIVAGPFILGELLLLMAFCTVFGLHCSLTCRKSMSAMWSAVGTNVLVGGGYLLCCIPLMMIPAQTGSRSEDFLMVILSPCMPFLLVYPSFASQFGTPSEVFLGVAWSIGTVGYAIVTYLLFLGTVGDFNRLAGRTLAHPDRQDPQDPPTIVASVVD